jgi:hypothetical protein
VEPKRKPRRMKRTTLKKTVLTIKQQRKTKLQRLLVGAVNVGKQPHRCSLE